VLSEDAEVEQVRLENLALRLERMENLLNQVYRMACPVCRPALLKEVHPEADWHDDAEWAVVKANGAHGK
jgi:hypothetical protein